MTRRWQILIETPFASLFLILSAICFSSVQYPKGLKVDIAVPLSRGMCGDGDGNVVAQILANGLMQVNGEETDESHFLHRVEEKFQNRNERLMFIISDENVTFGQIVSTIDAAKPMVDRIALLSHLVAQKPGDCGPALPAPKYVTPPVPGSGSVHFWRWF